MAIHTRHERGHLIYWDTHRKRVVGVQGPDVISYELKPEHLNATTVDPSGFTTTVVEVGAGTTEFDVSDAEGYIGRITCAANENDGGSYQLLGENIVFDGDHSSYFGLRFAINDADQTDFLFGACITDTALLGGLSDGMYFESLDGGASVSFTAEKDSNETQSDSLGTITDATDMTVEFYWDGTKVEAFIDGAQVVAPTTPANLPDNEALRLSLEFLTGEATANTMDVAWMRFYQWGRS